MKNVLPATVPLKKKEIACYGIFGGAGFLYSYLMFGSLILYYFTDVLGISMASAGVLLMIARIWDGINDPLMGLIIDKTHTRWGKNRPYILVGGILLAVFTVLLFSRPSFESPGMLLAWAYITYIGYDMAYTMYAGAMGSLPSRMTTDRAGYTKLASSFFAGTGVISVIASLTIMEIISFCSGPEGDMAKGYQGAAILGAVMVLVFSLLLFFTVRERNLEGENPAPVKITDALKAVFTNIHYIGFILSESIVLFGYYLSAGAIMYYCIYNLGSADYYTPLLICEYAAPLVASFLVPFMISRKMDLKNVALLSIALMGVSYFLRYLGGDSSVFLMTVLAAVGGLGMGCYNVLFNPISLDCAIYSEHKTGLQLQGFFVSSNSVLGKGVGGLAAACLAFFLDRAGYVEGAAEQTEAVLGSLRFCVTASVAITCLAGLLLFLATYRLKSEQLETMNTENISRRKLFDETDSNRKKEEEIYE